jgi:hypothetical protein
MWEEILERTRLSGFQVSAMYVNTNVFLGSPQLPSPLPAVPSFAHVVEPTDNDYPDLAASTCHFWPGSAAQLESMDIDGPEDFAPEYLGLSASATASAGL